MRILAIDPGIVGGWAVLDETGGIVGCGDIPTSGDAKHKMVDAPLMRAFIDAHRPDVAIIELVGAMPKQGVSSSFKFGRATGVVEGVIGGALIPVQWVSAAKWKKHFGLNADKEACRQDAIRRWPGNAAQFFSRKMDHGRAEACLIALYAIETGALSNPVSAGDPDGDREVA